MKEKQVEFEKKVKEEQVELEVKEEKVKIKRKHLNLKKMKVKVIRKHLNLKKVKIHMQSCQLYKKRLLKTNRDIDLAFNVLNALEQDFGRQKKKHVFRLNIF